MDSQPGEPQAAAPEQGTAHLSPSAIVALEQRTTAFAKRTNEALHEIKAQINGLTEAVLHVQQQQQEQQEASPSAPQPWMPAALLGYTPTPEQQAQLLAALAAWREKAPTLERNRTAVIKDRETGATKASYNYADLGAVCDVAATAGAHGLAFPSFLIQSNGRLEVVVLVTHSGGGALSSGAWGPPAKENRMTSAAQQLSGTITTARRLLIQNLLGLAAEEDDDFNPAGESSSRGQPQGRPAGRSGPPQRRSGTSAPTRTPAASNKPPEGFLLAPDRKRLEDRLAELSKVTDDNGQVPEEAEEILRKLEADDRAKAELRRRNESTTAD